jgi:hypothetical protein
LIFLHYTAKLEIYIDQYDDLFRVLLKTTSELENQRVLNIKIESEVEEQASLNTDIQKVVDESLKETNRTKVLHKLAQVTFQELDQEKITLESKKAEYVQRIKVIRDVELLVLRREIESADKTLISLKVELDVVKKRYGKGEKANKALYNLIHFNNVSTRNLSQELRQYEDESQQQKEEIRIILQEKDQFEHNVEIENQK